MTASSDRKERPPLPGQWRGEPDPGALVKASLPGSLAKLLDEWFTIPGTRIKIGLDPIIGFAFQALGDAATAVAGAFILREAVVRRVPRKVLVRMSVNLLINAGVGALPLVGDLFSVWFKSNAQNFALLQQHSGRPDYPDQKRSLWPVILIVCLALALIAAMAVSLVFLARALFS
jgi:hypothetical protein